MDERRKLSDFAYLDTMDEILKLAIEFIEQARKSQHEMTMRSYIWALGVVYRKLLLSMTIACARKQGDETK